MIGQFYQYNCAHAKKAYAILTVGVFVGVFGARLGPPDGLEEGMKLELGRVVVTPPMLSPVSLTFPLLGERSNVTKIPAMPPAIRNNAMAILYFKGPLRDDGGRLSSSPVL